MVSCTLCFLGLYGIKVSLSAIHNHWFIDGAISTFTYTVQFGYGFSETISLKCSVYWLEHSGKSMGIRLKSVGSVYK